MNVEILARGFFETLGYFRQLPTLPAGPVQLATPETGATKALFSAIPKGKEPTGVDFHGAQFVEAAGSKSLIHNDPCTGGEHEERWLQCCRPGAS